MKRRLDPIDPEQLAGAAKELYSRYATGERAAPDATFSLLTADRQLTGPPAAWMLSPQLGLGLERLGYGLRFELSLRPRWREIVILMVAAAEDSPFERVAHHQAAARVGLSDDEIALLDAGEFDGSGDVEAIVIATAREILDTAALTDSGWAAAERHLGRQAVFEIVTLIGWYRLMAMHLRIFGIEPPR